MNWVNFVAEREQTKNGGSGGSCRLTKEGDLWECCDFLHCAWVLDHLQKGMMFEIKIRYDT